MATRARRVEVVIGGDASGAARAFGTAGASAQRFQGQAQRSSLASTKAFRAIRVAAIGIGAGLAIAAKSAVSTAAEFETSMQKIVGLVGVSQGAVDSMSDGVKRLSAQYGKSAPEAADALFFITSAGLRGAEAMEVLEASLKGSVSGLGEVKDIADLATSVVNAYGSENISAGQAADVLAKAVQQGKLESEELAGAMGKVIPVAANMGISFDQVGGAMAAMSKTGTNADEAATQLRQIMVSLLKPTKEADETLAGLGLSAAGLRDQIGREGLFATLTTLTEAFGDNEEAQTAVFGNVRALVGVMDLMGAGFESNKKVMDAVANSTGMLDSAYAAVADTGSAKMQRAVAKMNVALIEFGNQIMPAVTDTLTGFSNVVSAIGPPLGKIASGLSTVGRAAFGSTIGTAALAAALGGLVATKAVAFLTRLVSGFRALAVVQATTAAMTGLSSTMTVLAGGFTRVSARTVGLAPGLTAAGAGMTRFTAAGNVAKRTLSIFGSAMLGFVGGPVGAVIAGVGAVVALFAVFARRTDSNAAALQHLTNVTNGYTTALTASKTAQQGFATASDRMIDAQIQQRSAAIGVREAERTLAQARSAGDTLAIERAEVGLTQARRQSNLANRDVAQSQRAVASSSANFASALVRVASQTGNTEKDLRDLERAFHPLTKAAAPAAYEKFRKELGAISKSGGTTESRLKSLQGAAADLATKVKGTTPAANDLRATLLGLANADAGQLKTFAADVEKGVKSGKTKAQAQKDAIAKLLKGVGEVRPEFSSYVEAIEAGGEAGFRAAEKWAGRTRAALKKVDPRQKGSPSIVDLTKAGFKALKAEVGAGMLDVLRETEKDGKKIRLTMKNALDPSKIRDYASGPAQEAFEQFRESVLAGIETTEKTGLGAYADRVSADGRLIVGRFTALSRQLDGAMADLDSRLAGSLAGVEDTLSKNLANLDGLLKTDLDAIDKTLKDRLDAIETRRLAPTGAERYLAQLEEQGAAEDLAGRRSEAGAKLAEAERIGDPRLIAEARAEAAKIEREAMIAEVRKTAEAERTAHDEIAESLRVDAEEAAEQARAQKQAAAETERARLNNEAAALRAVHQANAAAERQRISDDFEARRLLLEAERESDRVAAEGDLRRLQNQMARIPAILARGKKPAQKQLAKISRLFAVFGNQAGKNYLSYLTKNLNDLDTVVARALAKKVEPYLRLGSPAKKGPLSKLDEWFSPFSSTLFSSVDTAGIARSSAQIAGSSLPGRGAASGGVVVNVTVDGNQFDAREFARRLEPELARIVSAAY